MKTDKKTKGQHSIQIKVLILISILLLSTSTVYAHRLMIDPVDEYEIQVIYEDGEAIKNAGIQILDEEGEILLEGNADEEGYYSYEGEDQAHSIVADDGTGHKVTWVIGEAVEQHGEWMQYIKIIGVAAGLILISLYFGKKARESGNSSKKSKDSTQERSN